MSLLIVTSRYLKSGTAKTKSQRKNYTKYIATRESVEVREQSKKYSTENQKKLQKDCLSMWLWMNMENRERLEKLYEDRSSSDLRRRRRPGNDGCGAVRA